MRSAHCARPDHILQLQAKLEILIEVGRAFVRVIIVSRLQVRLYCCVTSRVQPFKSCAHACDGGHGGHEILDVEAVKIKIFQSHEKTLSASNKNDNLFMLMNEDLQRNQCLSTMPPPCRRLGMLSLQPWNLLQLNRYALHLYQC
jgi:hypothetical protein